MASQTLQRMEASITGIVARPAREIHAELEEIAGSDPNNPAPHLAMAIVNSFGLRDYERSKSSLEVAGQLLDQGAGDTTSPEWEFSRLLYQAIRGEVTIAELREAPVPAGGHSEDDLEQIYRASVSSQEALAKLGSVVSSIGESELVRLIYLALLTHSRAQGVKSPEFRRGMTGLRKMFNSQVGMADAAGLFVMYGYRRTHDYRRAIEVGTTLAERNPTSVLPVIMLGSANFFSGNYQVAAEQFRRAFELAPNDPHPYLLYAQALSDVNNLSEAREMIQKARDVDVSQELTRYIEVVEKDIRVREKVFAG